MSNTNTHTPDQPYYTSERAELIPFIPKDINKTLDVGCASGSFSMQLKKVFDVETWGIEMVEEVAAIAETKIDHVLKGSFDDVYGKLPKKYFDCVFFNDVLEHMIDPESCLRKIKENLAPGKIVIASIPNIRHLNVLKELLLRKDWKYTDSGIMDKTHVRFFTKRSIIRMFDDCGYKILNIKGINSISPYCLTSILNVLTFKLLEDIKHQQYVVVATPK
ncbi:MAG: class I SAM-dependent methyltransferase [Prevotella sp.]|jgi:2-polyprenyl-3-methyl-5-hydroxy-6-metoxy-1,4-benzoquinol methylase|nr:class I SAM-dependent methyltransferase [Prevotella sp.]